MSNPNVIIDNSRLFYRGVPNTWIITSEIKSAIEKLTFEFYEGGYVDKGLIWKLNNNIEVLNEFRPSDMKLEVFLNHIAISMQFLVRTLKIEHLSPEYIQENNIQPYHIQLANRLYIDYEDYDEPEIHTADKRPFGNSYMIGDIADEMGLDREIENEEIIIKVYHQILDLTLHIFKKIPISFSSFTFVGRDDYGFSSSQKKWLNLTQIQEKYLNHNWTVNISEHRDILIDELIK